MYKRLLISLAVLLSSAFSSYQSFAIPPMLQVERIKTPMVQVVAPNGERGAAIAQLRDGRLLLGGGKNGSNLYLFERATNSLKSLGRVIKASERLNDSRFAITDIAILEELRGNIALLISFPEYDKKNTCVNLVMYRYSLTLTKKTSLSRGTLWFRSSPCVPVSAVQHAAGRIEVIDKTSAYLTTGDLGFRKINDRQVRGTLGSIYKVTAKSVEQFSQGHRNPQGILLIGKSLYISEHGPRGGDELNLVNKGKDYGWPFVTYGEPYGAGDYVRPTNTGSHEGFTKPLHYWVPSVAPTELIQLPPNSDWGKWAGAIVMGTLRENSLIFIELTAQESIGEISTVNVGERIRDLEVDSQGTIIATTDGGELLLISPSYVE